MKANSYFLLLLITCCLSLGQGWAYEEKLVVALRGNSITTNATGQLSIQDQEYGQNQIRYQKTAAQVMLRIDERSRRKYTDNWRLTVSYTVKLYGINGEQLSHTPAHNLVIDHMRAGTMNDVALNIHQAGYATVRRAQLTITALKKELLHDDGAVILSSNLTTLEDSLFKDVILELQYHAEKYKKLSTLTPAPGHWVQSATGNAIMNPTYVVSASGISNNGCASGSLTPGNEVTFYWPIIDGAESYDFEYLFIDAGADPLCATQYSFDWFEAIRVNTKTNFFKIPLLFPRGRIVYRVRAVGVNTSVNVPNKIERGPWSSGPYNTGNTAMNSSFAYSGMEPTMNWTSSVQHAEDGKSKSVVSFFDGIGNARQSMTYSNSDSIAIIAENTFDHLGRQGLTLLPTVHDYSGFGFQHNLNSGFDRTVFDTDTVFSPNSTFQGIPAGTATYDYYSDQNWFLNYAGNDYPKILRRSLAAYQADAEGFPFSQKRYSNDGLGRIQAESQPGYAHRLGGGHDTRFFYGAPGTQAELDRLFGNEVGYVANYRKEMIVDHNGQVRIQYKDGYDRTIATALAGTNVAPKLHLIEAATQSPTLSADVLDNNHINLKNELEASKSFLIGVPNTNYHIQYQADTLLFRDICLGVHPCAFEISIAVIDEEGNHLLDFDNNPSSAEPSWQSFTAATGFTYSETITLPEVGKYTLVKRVRINEGAISTLQNAVIQNIGSDTSNAGPCFTPPDFAPPCNDCEQNCESSFKYEYSLNGIAYTVYHSATPGLAGLTTSAILAATTSENNTSLFGLISQTQSDSIENLIAECKNYCTQTPVLNSNTECDVILGALKRDLAPGGQYFDNLPKNPVVDTTNTDAEYYHSGEDNPRNINYWLFNYASTFRSTFGNLVGIVNAGWDTIRNRWGDIEAAPGFEALMDQFVQIHPEYCLWKARCENRDDSCSCSRPGAQQLYYSISQYENALYATNDDSTAKAQMLFLPLGNASFSSFDPIGITPQTLESNYCFKDPLLSECNDPMGIYTAMAVNHLNQYLIAGPETLSIWQVLEDPTGIHLLDTSTYTGPLPIGLITYMQTLHGNGTYPGLLAPFGQSPAPGQLSIFSFFRSAYQAIRLLIFHRGETDAFAACAPADHPLFYFSQHSSSAPGALQPLVTQLPYLNTLDSNNDGYIDVNLALHNYATPPAMNFSGFQVRIPKLDLQIPPTLSGLSATFCDQMVNALPSLWIAEMESLNGCVRIDNSNPDTLRTQAYQITGIEKAVLRDYFERLVADGCAAYSTSLVTANPLPAVFNVGSSATSIYSGLPWGLPAANSAQEIVNLFMVQTGTVGCPQIGNLSLNDTSAMQSVQELSCSCHQLKDVILSSSTLKTPYTHINPFKYAVFAGIPAADIFETHALLSYLGNMDSGLLAPYDTTSLYAAGSALVLNWIDRCSGTATQNTTLVHQGVFMDGLRCAPPVVPINLNNCNADYQHYYRMLKQKAFIAYQDSQLSRFNRIYEGSCLQRLLTQKKERFTVSYALNEYHYTLYYYDRAGNMVKSIPPKGVVPIDNAAELARIDGFRKAHSYKSDYASILDPQLGTFTRPLHFKSSNYLYNSKEQVTRQRSPDGGETLTYFDFMGRPAISQNAQQKVENNAVYTLYDEIGRIYETGLYNRNLDELSLGNYSSIREMIEAMPDSTLNGMTPLNYLLDLDHNREQITRTHYDHSHFDDWGFSQSPLLQSNLRNRIASTAYYEKYPTHWRYFDNANHYTYDVQGNVKTLIQDVPPLQPFGKRFIKTEYEYDQISGKTNAVHFMANQPEHFSHYFRYDADNRLIQVATSSNNGILRETEAKYFYFPTGQLARIELGRKQVQGIDYTLSINGWIKGSNTEKLNPYNDRGKDGLPGNNLHGNFAVDAMGYTLTYFSGDYTAIGAGGSHFQPFELSVPNNSLALSLMNFTTPAVQGQFGIYNGNVVKMSSNTLDCSGKPMDVIGRFFQYDQLNRLKYSNSLTLTNAGAWNSPNVEDWNSPNSQEIYASEISYDADGNITHLIRTDENQSVMDNLEYNYEPTGINNALLFVKDYIAGNSHTGDIRTQNQGNYQYDAIGNLTTDLQNDSAQISWNIAGKIQNVDVSQGTDLTFSYNPDGHRITKKVNATQQKGAILQIYALNGEGSPLAMYTVVENIATGKFQLSCNQRTLFGCDRIGINEQNIRFSEVTGYPIADLDNSQFQHFDPQSIPQPAAWEAPTKLFLTLGQKQYELSNHLGNVLATVSDRKVYDPTTDSDASNVLKRFRPEIRTATEYYPFGSPLPDWGCSAGVQCTTEVVTQTSELTLSNFVNNVQKSGTTQSTPDCSNGPRNSGTCLRIEFPSQNDIAFLAFTPVETGPQELTTSISFLQEDYTNSLNLFLVEMDGKGSKVVDTVFTSTVTNNADTVKQKILYFNGSKEKIYRIGYKQKSSGVSKIRWLSVKLMRVTETYVRNCGQQAPGEGGYQYGYNGQEKENNLYNIEGSAYTFEYRIHDTRLGRFLSVDPLSKEYPWNSTYAFAENNVIQCRDLEGAEANASTTPAIKPLGVGFITTARDESSASIVNPLRYQFEPQKRVIDEIRPAPSKLEEYDRHFNPQNISHPLTAQMIVRNFVEGFTWEFASIKAVAVAGRVGTSMMRTSYAVAPVFTRGILARTTAYTIDANRMLNSARAFTYTEPLGSYVGGGLTNSTKTYMWNYSGQVLNTKGVAYPKVHVEGYGLVPFPQGPFSPNNSKVLRSQFTPKFKMEFKEWWMNQGRPWPEVPNGSTLNIHHIKPLSHGGKNVFDNLVPLIQPEQHQPFTNWWRNFKPQDY